MKGRRVGGVARGVVAVATLALFGWPAPARAAGPTIENVAVDRVAIRPQAGEHAVVTFRLGQPAQVRLDIWDSRDLRVRSIATQGALEAGERSLVWDGKDASGAVVPPEAYAYTLTATASDATSVTHDLTDLSRGSDTAIEGIAYDPKAKTVSYVLPGPSRVGIRAGLGDGGPLLETIVNWEPRVGVAQTETWDGVAGIDPGALVLWGTSYRLPDNTIVVLPAPGGRFERAFVAQAGERRPRKEDRRRMYQHSQHTRDVSFDFPLDVAFVTGVTSRDGGVVTIGPGAVLRIDVREPDRRVVERQRFEIVFYLDGVFVTELEQGYLPFQWPIDYGAVPPGEHLLTVNLRGYEGYFGVENIRFARPASAAVQGAASK